MNYCPNTPIEQKEMLAKIGVSCIDDLFSPIPENLRVKSFNLPEGKSEAEVLQYFQELSLKNKINPISFLGAGIYDHFIPAAVDALSGRAEFYTAYTPYQPECSQGTLQALFEYQTAICRLTGMEVSNASLYDGATALAEGALMAIRLTGKKRILLDGAVHPHYRTVVKSYLANVDAEVIDIEVNHDQINVKDLEKQLNDQTAAYLVQNPNFFGTISDLTTIAGKLHEKEALLVLSCYPMSLGLLKIPTETGADIVTGDGQSLGNPMAFGGPSLGYIATWKKNIRQIPGRIIGETVDKTGKRAFVLTLQAREQHIKRQKATSNICSNQSLCALRSVIYLSLLGKEGFAETAKQCFDKAEYTKKLLSGIKGLKIWNTAPTFNEFVVELPCNAEEIVKNLKDEGITAGLPLGIFNTGYKNLVLIAVTEKMTKEKIDAFYKALGAVC